MAKYTMLQGLEEQIISWVNRRAAREVSTGPIDLIQEFRSRGFSSGRVERAIETVHADGRLRKSRSGTVVTELRKKRA